MTTITWGYTHVIHAPTECIPLASRDVEGIRRNDFIVRSEGPDHRGVDCTHIFRTITPYDSIVTLPLMVSRVTMSR